MTKNTTFIGASQPLTLSTMGTYRMQTERYVGSVLYIVFKTEFDVSRWLPAPLKAVDPHKAFLKIYHLRRRPEQYEIRPNGYNTYYEVCLTVEATLNGEGEPRHYNVFMWLDHDWAIYKAREVLGWPKKMASIDISWPKIGSEIAEENSEREFGVDVGRYGHPMFRLTGTIDDGPKQTIPAFNGFYSVRHLISPDGDAAKNINQLLKIDTIDGWASTPRFGNAKLEFFGSPDEELNLLGEVEVIGCSLRETGWTLPAWPAEIIGTAEVSTDYGD